MFFILPMIGAAISAIGAGASATAAAVTTTAGLGLLVKGAVGIAARKALLSAATKGVVGAALCGVTKELGESVVKNVFCDTVKLRRGSVLKVDLVAGGVTHSGVYLGHDRIAEVTEIGGDAIVQEVSPSEFLHGNSPVRTGAYVYVAASNDEGKYRALASVLNCK